MSTTLCSESTGSSPHTRGALRPSLPPPPPCRDRPRIRGEHHIQLSVSCDRDRIIPAYAGSTCHDYQRIHTTRGSSPHTRGAPHGFQGVKATREDHPRIRGEHRAYVDVVARYAGIIPAYAGSTVSAANTYGMPEDHPRIRGEHRLRAHRALVHAGIIPAYAGSTRRAPSPWTAWPGSSPHTRGAPTPSPSACPRAGDHPRIRGEHEVEALDCVVGDGIIPAYAGSTYVDWDTGVKGWGSSPHTRGAPSSEAMTLTHRRDHPRIRGEHFTGSLAMGGIPGIIPACAGSTEDRMRYCRSLGDHPRIRGEHRIHSSIHDILGGIIPAYAGSTDYWSTNQIPDRGSSPHTRGARKRYVNAGRGCGDHPRIRGEHPMLCFAQCRLSGIIPAYAGSTIMSTTLRSESMGSSPHTRGAPPTATGWGSARRDHPRIRGEHPPRTRARAREQGIIPAYAGSTAVPYGWMYVIRGSSPHTRGALSLPVQIFPSAEDHPRIRGEHRQALPDGRSRDGIIPAYAGSTFFALLVS